MKLRDLLGHNNVGQMLEEMLDPTTAKPPREKGPDAIKVGGYIVHGHWRRRWVNEAVLRRRRAQRRARALTPSEMEEQK